MQILMILEPQTKCQPSHSHCGFPKSHDSGDLKTLRHQTGTLCTVVGKKKKEKNCEL